MVDLLDPIWETLVPHIDTYMSHITSTPEMYGDGRAPINMACTPSIWNILSGEQLAHSLVNRVPYKGNTIRIFVEKPGTSWIVHAASRQDERCEISDNEILLVNTRSSAGNSYHNSTGGFVYKIPIESILEGGTITDDENLLLNENIVLI